jgi:hypothetical protein
MVGKVPLTQVSLTQNVKVSDLTSAPFFSLSSLRQLQQYRSLLDSFGGAALPPTPRGTRTLGGAALASNSAVNSRRTTADDIAAAAGLQPNSPAAQVGAP